MAFRKEQIAQIGYLVKDNEDRLIEALKLDLGRPALETELYVTLASISALRTRRLNPQPYHAADPPSYDFGPTYKDVRLAYDNVERWTQPQSTDFNISYFAMGPKLKAEPKGVVLIVSAFNVPVFLTLSPLVRVPFICLGPSPRMLIAPQVSAVAAGCAAVIKPSEANPHFCKLLAELLPKYLDPDLYHVVQGGVPEMTKVRRLF